MFILGNKIRDRVTGLEGIATARVEYLNGCIQFCLTPSIDKEGKLRDSHYIDVGQLEVVDDGINVESTLTGGPQRHAPKT